MSREDDIAGGKALLAAIDAADQRAELARQRRDGDVVRRDLSNVRELRPRRPAPPPSRDELVRQQERWEAWACPAQPSRMIDEPVLARLRERWPADGSGEGPGDMLAAFGPLRREERGR